MLYVNIYLSTEEEDIPIGSCIVWDHEGGTLDHDPGKSSQADKNIVFGKKTEGK
jgi:hypothetical protein